MTIGRNQATYYGVAAIAGVAAVAVICFDNIVAKPDAGRLRLNNTIALRNARHHAAVQKEVSEKKAKAVGKRLWTGAEDEASPALMAEISRLAAGKGITMSSFRPQKVKALGSLKQLGFAMNVEGSFPQIMAFVAAVEKTQAKAAVTQVQLTASDASAEIIKGQIAISAFAPDAEKPDKTGRASEPAKTRQVAANE